ncbi:Protein F44E2.4 [Aphelenchoides avenae]|nr:Protein F44E2.4 [Aphelenchus avenae]
MRAGNGICNRENVSAAIDENLGCIFKQVSDPNFGKCLVSTLANLKQFTIAALKGVLPKFIACIEPIVIPKCGEVPINVLKALSSQDVCPIRYAEEPAVEKLEPIKQEVQECTEQMSADYTNCTEQFYKTFGFEPITLLQANHSMDEVCTEDTALSACMDKLYLCESSLG